MPSWTSVPISKQRSGTRTAAAGIIQNRQHSRGQTGRSAAAFEGSDRKIRGSIIRILLAGGRMTQTAILQKFTEEEIRVIRILKNLEDEGFIVRSGAWVSIASR